MAVEPGYPKVMTNPAYAQAELGLGPGEGKPVRFPPVTVHSKDQEEMFRAQGYRLPGEVTPLTPFAEYPRMLYHPDHVPAVLPYTDFKRDEDGAAVKDENGQVIFYTIPGKSGINDPVAVNSLAEEAAYALRGYTPSRRMTIVFHDGTRRTVG